jgi:prepilin-type N-terminal cleavage/methylation domain-containing protein
MSVTSAPPSPTGGESGFTLIEVLVAIVLGVIVSGALFAILEVSLHQTARINDRVQATQLGRTSMTKVIDNLHSACLSREFAPVNGKSSGSVLRFATGFSEKAVIEPSETFEHEVIWNGVYPGGGTLVDKTYNANAATSWPSFTYVEPAAKTERISENVYAETRAGKEVPIFQYYEYSVTPSAGGVEAPTSTLTQIPLKAGEKLEAKGKAVAASVAAVQVTLSQAPADNNLALSRSAEFSNLVTFAFASPASEATITDGPCQ